MKKQRVAVGFYKKDGKTRPIIKSVGQLNRKKMISTNRTFQGISPKDKFAHLQFFVTAYCKKNHLPNLEVEKENIDRDVAVSAEWLGGKNTVFTIKVNPKISADRLAVAVAHELGHWKDYVARAKGKLNFFTFNDLISGDVDSETDPSEVIRSEIRAWKNTVPELRNSKIGREYMKEAIATYLPEHGEVFVHVVKQFIPAESFEWRGNNDYDLENPVLVETGFYTYDPTDGELEPWQSWGDFGHHITTEQYRKYGQKVAMPTLTEILEQLDRGRN